MLQARFTGLRQSQWGKIIKRLIIECECGNSFSPKVSTASRCWRTRESPFSLRFPLDLKFLLLHLDLVLSFSILVLHFTFNFSCKFINQIEFPFSIVAITHLTNEHLWLGFVLVFVVPSNSMAAPPARARADYDYLIKLLLIGDSGTIFVLLLLLLFSNLCSFFV